MKKRERLKQMLTDRDTYLIPGVFDCIGARVAEQAGFEALLVTGNGAAASMAGLPDIGLVTMTEVVQGAQRIAGSVECPVIADADTGYGQPLNFMRTIRAFEETGVSGIHLEDQISPKKCAYYGGLHEVVPVEEQVQKLRAGLSARTDPNFCIIARTDAKVRFGLDEAVRRANRYLAEGADAAFIVGLCTIEEAAAAASRVEGPLVININDESELNRYTKSDFQQAGIKVVLYPATLRSVFLRQAAMAMERLNADGNTQQVLERLATLGEFQILMDVSAYQELETRFSLEKAVNVTE